VTDFLTEPAFEIGRRLEIRGSSAWFVVLRPAEDEDALANFMADLCRSRSAGQGGPQFRLVV
jgi:hypothetical protein